MAHELSLPKIAATSAALMISEHAIMFDPLDCFLCTWEERRKRDIRRYAARFAASLASLGAGYALQKRYPNVAVSMVSIGAAGSLYNGVMMGDRIASRQGFQSTT